MHTKTRGDISEVKVLAAFIEAGIPVSIPWGENQRYDMIVEVENGSLLKVQCKTARLISSGDKLEIPVTSYNYSTEVEGTRRDYKDDVDLIAAYSSDLDKVYLLSPEGVSVYLRLKPTKNGQEKNVKWAEDYEFEGTMPE